MIFKGSLVLFKILIIYVLLVLIQGRVNDEIFLDFYYIVVFVSIYIWVYDFGTYYYTSKNGVNNSANKISRNLLVQLLSSPFLVIFLSLFTSNEVAVLIVGYSITSYLLLIFKASLINKNKIIYSLVIDYFSMAPLYALFYSFLDLSLALCVSIIVQLCLLILSYFYKYLVFAHPIFKFERFDSQMFVSNIFSLPGSYVDVFFAKYFVSDLSVYILVREAVMKMPSLLQPIYNNIFYPLLLKESKLFDRFFLFNAILYIIIFLIGWCFLTLESFSESTKVMVLLLGVLVVLKGFGSLHGALMMSQMASHLSMIKNIIFLVTFASASVFSFILMFNFKEWFFTVILFYSFCLLYDFYILYKLNMASFFNSSLIVFFYTFCLVLCMYQ